MTIQVIASAAFSREEQSDAVGSNLKPGQIRVVDLPAPHQHLAVLGAALQGGDHLAGVEQALRVEGAFDAKHLLVFSR